MDWIVGDQAKGYCFLVYSDESMRLSTGPSGLKTSEALPSTSMALRLILPGNTHPTLSLAGFWVFFGLRWCHWSVFCSMKEVWQYPLDQWTPIAHKASANPGTHSTSGAEGMGYTHQKLTGLMPTFEASLLHDPYSMGTWNATSGNKENHLYHRQRWYDDRCCPWCLWITGRIAQ